MTDNGRISIREERSVPPLGSTSFILSLSTSGDLWHILSSGRATEIIQSLYLCVDCLVQLFNWMTFWKASRFSWKNVSLTRSKLQPYILKIYDYIIIISLFYILWSAQIHSNGFHNIKSAISGFKIAYKNCTQLCLIIFPLLVQTYKCDMYLENGILVE